MAYAKKARVKLHFIAQESGVFTSDRGKRELVGVYR